MALSADIKQIRFGTPGNASQPVNQPLKASQTVYRGSVAATRSGYLVPMSSPLSTDVVWGIVDKAGPGTADTGPGIVGGSTDGAVTVEIATGTFFLKAGSGADALTQANVGATVYLIDEQTVGATSSGNTRPVAGILMALGNNVGNIVPIAGMVAVKLGSAQSTGAPQ